MLGVIMLEYLQTRQHRIFDKNKQKKYQTSSWNSAKNFFFIKENFLS